MTPDHGPDAPLLLVANLDAEEHLSETGSKRRTLPASVCRTIAPLAALMRVFARSDDDLLWLAPEVAGELSPKSLAPRSGLPRPRVVTGPLDRLGHSGPVLAWADTGPVGRRVLSRRFAAELAETGAIPGLPGARLVASVGEIDAAVAGKPPPGAIGWVVKALYGASGRHRLVHRGWTAPDASIHPHLKSLLRRSGELLFEPWMDRVDDFGSVGIVSGDGGEGVEVLGLHRLEVDARGAFRGIDLDGGTELSGDEAEQLEDATRAAGRALARAGHRGPFGVDAWRYRGADGSVLFHPAGEINARMTFGYLVRAWEERTGIIPLAS
jgi:hypothetical protein